MPPRAIPGLGFDNRARHSRWPRSGAASDAFQRFRGTDWMPEPCRSCDQREIDWGGCRCQALALTGEADATDPACVLSPFHDTMLGLAETAAHSEAPPDFVYRRMRGPAEPVR